LNLVGFSTNKECGYDILALPRIFFTLKRSSLEQYARHPLMRTLLHGWGITTAAADFRAVGDFSAAF
jgi:hypothetical protein